MDVAAAHGDAACDLLLDQPEVTVLHQLGCDALVGKGLELGARVSGVAVALHHRQVGVVAVGTGERAGLEGLQEHGAAGRKAAAIALAPLSRVALLEAGHTHQGIGAAAAGGRGQAALLMAVPEPPQRSPLLQCLGVVAYQLLQHSLQPGPVLIQLRIEMLDVVAGGDGEVHRNTPRRPGVRTV
jgi:hypothetical protein